MSRSADAPAAAVAVVARLLAAPRCLPPAARAVSRQPPPLLWLDALFARTASPLPVGSPQRASACSPCGCHCRLYFKVTGTAIPLESVDIVYSIFDADQDGALAMDEVLGMMNEEGRIDNRALQALADADPDAADHDSQESSADRL